MNGIPLNIDFQQILLHLFNVVILFAIIWFLIYSPIRKFMEKRKQEYQDMEDQATGKVKEAEELKASYEEKLQGAGDEIREMKAQASKEAADRAHAIEEDARAEAKAIVEQARTLAENEKEKILDSAGDEVAKMAREAVSKALFEDPSQAYDSFLNSAQ